MPQTQLIKQLIDADLPFAAFRLPGKKEEIQIIAQNDLNVEEIDISEIEMQKGFVCAAFESAMNGKAWLIRPDIYVPDAHSVSNQKVSLDNKTNNFKITNLETSNEDYLHRVEYLINFLNDSSLEKIVFSRMINLPPFPDFDEVDFFNALDQKYKDAYVYMFKLPDSGIWIGASPETLFHLTEEQLTTVALAGTRPTDNISWTDKEINEQKIVRDFIHDTIEKNKIKHFVERGPVTIIAGTVVHLKTIFQIPAEEVIGKAGKLIKALHPTPAVCGLPKDQAFELIKKVEKHERRFYTGFSGPWNLGSNSYLFVNLRCAEVGKAGMNLYVGGGITVDSDPAKEWDETVRKSQTLLSVIEKL